MISKKSRPMRRRALACLPAVMLLASVMQARAAEIRVFSSGAPAAVERIFAATLGAEAGYKVTVIAGTPGTIGKKLAEGEKPDILVLPKPAIDSLERAGVLRPDSRIDLARVGIGVVVRAGAPLPDISSVASIRALLVKARSIVHTNPAGSGFAGAAVVRMMTQMGIADSVKSKVTIMQAIDGGVDLVADGKAEIGLFNISEILPVKGVTLVGPLPAELQSYIVFTAAIYAASPSPSQAQAFIGLLSAPSARDRWKEGGLEALRSQ